MLDKPYLFEIARLCRVTIGAADRVFEAYPPEEDQPRPTMIATPDPLDSLYVALNAAARIGDFIDAPAARDRETASKRSVAIRQAVGDPQLLVIPDRHARNSIEHYDERLDDVRRKLVGLRLERQYAAAESLVLSDMTLEDAPEFPFKVYSSAMLPNRLIFPLRVYEMNSATFYTIEDVTIDLRGLRQDAATLLAGITGDQHNPFMTYIGPSS